MSSMQVAGQIIDGKYKIEKQLGKGGMGTVFLATHIGTSRPVAVKVIASEFMERSEFIERFRREARAAGRLRHPNVVDVTDFGFSIGENGQKTAYLVMEYLDGCTLGEVLEEEKHLPVEFTVDILEQVCSAVSEAHRQGIIHRDLKPDNIWLEPNLRGGYTVKVLDFGIAKLEARQMIGAANVTDEMLVSDHSKTVLEERKRTFAEAGGEGTQVEGDQATVIGENETLALIPESGTIAGNVPSEAGTIVQEVRDEDDSESLESNVSVGKTASDDAGKTAVLSSSDKQGTRLIAKDRETDEGKIDASDTANLTRAGAVLGTPLYMSPEQCRGEKLSPASDIYSLSVIVYQMLSGKLPFNGDYVEVMNGHKDQEPPPLEAKKVPKRLKSAVMDSLSKNPDDRPVSAEAFASKLRAHSEGLGVLLRRALVMYGQHLPKFLLLTLIAYLPVFFLTFVRVSISVLIAAGVIEDNGLGVVNSAGMGLLSFFVQGVTMALLIGMTTWIVGRVLAFPLRPISIRSAMREVKRHWKSLAKTVTVSNLIIFLGFMFCLIPGVWLSARYMMIAPSIMMEGLGGRAAFKRSIELYKRATWTMLSISFLYLVIPVVLAFVVGFSIGSAIQNIERSKQIAEMKRTGVTAEKPGAKESVDLNIGPTGVVREEVKIKKPDGTVTRKNMRDSFSVALQEGLFEILWTPIVFFFTSFSTVLTALIYFKLRQAGGESLDSLYSQIDDHSVVQSNWEIRVHERLNQSGRGFDSKSNSAA